MSTVALYHCDKESNIRGRVEGIISSLGRERVTALFANKRVLIKPNICIDFPPEKGATTHPALVDAMIGIAKDCGAAVTVGDGPIVGVKGRIFEITGIAEVCRKQGVPLVNLNQGAGRTVSRENAAVFRNALIAEAYFESDTLVNLPVFKSNALYWLSGALKNMKGLLVGKEKHRPHEIDVPRCVADLNMMVRQDLVVMDGFIGMMGDGPAAGPPADARLLMGGFDPVAVDSAAAVLMGFPLERIPMIQHAAHNGAGSTEFEIIGDPIGSFDLPFEKPMIARTRLRAGLFDRVQKHLMKTAVKRSRVLVDPEKCTVCGRCVTACPFNAVRIHSKAVEIDETRCDICLCCHEACPQQAVYIKGLLSRADAFLRNM